MAVYLQVVSGAEAAIENPKEVTAFGRHPHVSKLSSDLSMEPHQPACRTTNVDTHNAVSFDSQLADRGQESLVLRYLASVFARIEQLDEDRLMPLVEQHSMVGYPITKTRTYYCDPQGSALARGRATGPLYVNMGVLSGSLLLDSCDVLLLPLHHSATAPLRH